jgi:Tfp pilus assembly protein PilF
MFLVLSPFLVSQTTLQDPKNNCELFVRIRTNSELSIDTPIQVEVLVPQGVFATANVIGDNTVQFRVTSGKSYRLRVSGSDIEALTTSYFDIEGLETQHTETVHVRLDKQKQVGETAHGSTSVSVSEMNIPRKASTEMKKGLDAYSKGEMEQAAAHFETATADYPHYARAYDMLGAIAIKEGNRGNARDMFSKAVQIDGTFVPGYVDLARMDLQDHQYADSESLLTKAISLNPSMPEAVALLATTEFANKEYDKALADVERTHALSNHQQFAEVHIMAGKVLSMQNHRAAAITQFQFFLMEKPDSPEGDSVRKAIASLQAGQRP